MAKIAKHCSLIEKEFLGTFNDKEKVLQKRRSKMSSSRLPYCPLRDAYEFMVRKHDFDSYDKYEEFTLDNYIYMGNGTIVHELIQNQFPKTTGKIQIYGYWKPTEENAPDCKKKKCPYKDGDDYTFEKMGKKGCKVCGGRPEYEEVSFFKGRWNSKVDGFVRIKGTKDFYLVDYKTCSKQNIMDYQRKGEGLPKKDHAFQMGSYGIHLRKFLKDRGFNYKGAMLVYTARDNPKFAKVVWVEVDYDDMWKRLNKCADGYKQVSKALREENFDEETLSIVKENKLCDNKEYYENIVHNRYDPCPLKDVCFSKKSLNKKLEQVQIKPKKKKKKKGKKDE